MFISEFHPLALLAAGALSARATQGHAEGILLVNAKMLVLIDFLDQVIPSPSRALAGYQRKTSTVDASHDPAVMVGPGLDI